MVVNSIQRAERAQSTAQSASGKAAIPFRDILDEAISQLNETEAEALKGQISLLTNGGMDLHTIMINTEKADIALQYTLQIRNKMIDAYNEIMRMQL